MEQFTSQLPVEPFRIKMVERISLPGTDERKIVLEEAHFNVFNIPAEKVFIDLLTDSGTSAMSDNQWAGLVTGDESYASCRNYFNLENSVKDILGFDKILPVHQGRAAENVFFSTMLKPGNLVPNNTHFDTTRANILSNKGQVADLVIDAGRDPELELPFKGNMDTEKLENLLREEADNIPVVLMTVTNNSGGGQPVSMGNIREVSEICKKYNKLFFFDAARFAENAFFIKKREKSYEDISIVEIVREMFSYSDGALISAKKDGLVNIGGLICLRDEKLFTHLMSAQILMEGFRTYGGLAGRDLEALARGLREVVDERYLNYRISQVQYLGKLLEDNEIPILKPVGGHAVYINAKKFVPHIPQEHFPAQALTCELYRQAGIRGVEIGSFMFGEPDPNTGKVVIPAMELVRLAIPRRVYTNLHMQYIAEACIHIFRNRDQVKGLRIVESPPLLRHFTAKLEEI